mmetsp:Transcript_9434/g.17117  ORF Transcript_9434/g.17117 Transcript_9434/m.17117 type:complete len:178 (-) Transcript_9434:36-569(-)
MESTSADTGKWPRRLLAATVAVAIPAAAYFYIKRSKTLAQKPAGSSDAAKPAAKPATSSGSRPLTGLAAQRAAALKETMEAEDGPIEDRVDKRLRAKFKPDYLEVINQGGTCSAPKLGILMVSAAFQGKKRIDRQREVQALLRADLDANYIHAISMQLKTPEEKAEYDKRAATGNIA